MVNTVRLNKKASSFEEAFSYYVDRNKQLAILGLACVGIEDLGTGVHATMTYQNETYSSIYVYEQFRGNNGYMKLYDMIKYNGREIITIADCDLEMFLGHKGIPFRSVSHPLLQSREYQLISDAYGSDRAKRSQVYFMNHIDEGLYILDTIQASYAAKRAYMVHPLVQSDEDLLKNRNLMLDPEIMMLAMEYRSVANEYLSFNKIDAFKDIRLSPLKEVNDMLIADKIQNFKDFMKYHMGKHERSKELFMYFMNWFAALDVNKIVVDELTKEIENLEKIHIYGNYASVKG